jgi:hypothetical protein
VVYKDWFKTRPVVSATNMYACDDTSFAIDAIIPAISATLPSRQSQIEFTGLQN